MPDFFEEGDNKGTADADNKIKLGDYEYGQDELNELVKLGKIAKDVEERFDTKIDRVYPEYTKSQQKLKSYEADLESYRKKVEQYEATNRPGEFTVEQKTAAVEQLQKLLGGKVVTDRDLDNWYSQKRTGEKLLEECEDLESQIDGGDGRPKFKTKDILDYMAETGVKKPELAYKQMYENELEHWKNTELSKGKGKMITTESGVAEKSPPSVKITRDNLFKMISEEMNSGGQE